MTLGTTTAEAELLARLGVIRMRDVEGYSSEEVCATLCDGCRFYLEQMQITIATVGRIEEADVPPQLRDTVVAAFRNRRV